MQMRSSLSYYFNDISRYPLLTADQEQELGRRYKEEGDSAARDKLINCNLRLVVKIAKNYRNANTTFDDLIMEGNLGLMTAVEKYDYKLGYRFSTCAVPWIRQAITKSIIDKSRAIRIPAHIIQLFNKEKAALDELTTDDHEPTAAEVAAHMGITEAKLYELRRWKQNTISMDSPISDDGDTLYDLLSQPDEQDPREYADQQLTKDKLHSVLDDMDERHRLILTYYYGLDGNEPHTLEEIGTMLPKPLSRERVRQLKAEAESILKMKLSGAIK